MVDSFDRWCLFCDFEIHASHKAAPQPSLDDYVDDLIAKSNRKEAKRIFEHDNRITRISSARRATLPDGSPCLEMLITLGDKRGATPSFVDFDGGDARDAERFDGEVKGASAHCILRLTEDHDHPSRYRMLLEEVRGLGRTPVTRLLATVLRELSVERGDQFRNPESNRMNALRPVVAVNPRRSQEMAQALSNSASFLPVQLIDTRPIPTFDENPEYSVRRHYLSVKVRPAPGRTLREAMSDLARTANAEGYSKMHVSWRLPGESRGGSVDLRTDLADIGTALFAHRELIHVSNPLSECAADLNDEFVQAMAEVFR